MLQVTDLAVRYGKVPAVKGISFSVSEGEIVCLVGPNGAGKSTTLKAIAGELAPHAGSIRLGDEDIAGKKVEDVVRRGVALVPENRHIFGRMTVEENLRLATFARRDKAAAEQQLEHLAERFPILHQRRGSPAGRLSGGEQQQLAIARGLLMAPRLLMVDEPTLGLAPMMAERIYQMLRDARAGGTTLLVVEQSLERALNVADRLFVLRVGEIQIGGTRAELLANSNIQDAYFGVHQAAAQGDRR